MPLISPFIFVALMSKLKDAAQRRTSFICRSARDICYSKAEATRGPPRHSLGR